MRIARFQNQIIWKRLVWWAEPFPQIIVIVSGVPHFAKRSADEVERSLKFLQSIQSCQGVPTTGARENTSQPLSELLAMRRFFDYAERSLCERPATLRMTTDGESACGPRQSRQTAALLILRQLFHGTEQVVGLGQDGIFQNRLVRNEDVFRGNAANRSIQLIE